MYEMITSDELFLAAGIYTGINALAFSWYAYDKSIAGTGRFRTPERVLLFLALIGPFGAFGAMQIFRHKTRKIKFWLVPVFLVLHVMVIISIFTGILRI